jgi:hypothetical protein
MSHRAAAKKKHKILGITAQAGLQLTAMRVKRHSRALIIESSRGVNY